MRTRSTKALALAAAITASATASSPVLSADLPPAALPPVYEQTPLPPQDVFEGWYLGGTIGGATVNYDFAPASGSVDTCRSARHGHRRRPGRCGLFRLECRRRRRGRAQSELERAVRLQVHQFQLREGELPGRPAELRSRRQHLSRLADLSLLVIATAPALPEARRSYLPGTAASRPRWRHSGAGGDPARSRT